MGPEDNSWGATGAKIGAGGAGFLALRHALSEVRKGVHAVPQVAKDMHSAYRTANPSNPTPKRKGLRSSKVARRVTSIIRAVQRKGAGI